MSSAIQQRINPVVPSSQLDFAKGDGKLLDPDPEDQIDFLKLLNNSNAQVQREREAKKNGDLSGAKSYDDFLSELEKQTTKLREPKNNLDKDDFLKLFVTQLQNQDPLNPEKSTEMASRLAHFNSLEQMLNVNKTLEKMHSAQTQSRSVGMVNYIGKEISVEGGRIKLKEGQYNESTFNIRRPASSSTLEIRNEAGIVVATKSLGTLPEGAHTFKWDGLNMNGERVPDGTYTYSVTAKGINDEDIPVAIETKTKITGVDIKSEKGGLFTPLGIVGVEDIKSIGESGFAAVLNEEKSLTPEPAESVKPAINNEVENQEVPQVSKGSPAADLLGAKPKAADSVAETKRSLSEQSTSEQQAAKPVRPEQPASDNIPG